jgi:DNA-binding NarL/FixJ family response regulator
MAADETGSRVITVAIVDDHPAVRLGLHAALRSEAGLEPVGSAANANESQVLLYRARPDVVLLDYHLPDMDGLTLCRRIKSDVPAPAVVLYSAFADPTMTVPAIVAGADAIVHKGGQTRELFDAIRETARGSKALPPVSEPLLEAAGQALDPHDLPLLGMLVNRGAGHGRPAVTRPGVSNGERAPFTSASHRARMGMVMVPARCTQQPTASASPARSVLVPSRLRHGRQGESRGELVAPPDVMTRSGVAVLAVTPM